MTREPVRVLGPSGPPVLLLPGGAESAEGFFPVVQEGLLDDPGCRVILYDRVGTGRSQTERSLPGASADLHEVIAELGLGPVVVIGQSLGSAVALLLAADHPEDVAGLVLLDPTPINDPALARKVAAGARTTDRLARIPLLGRGVRALLRRTATTSIRKHGMTGEVAAAMRKMTELDIPQLARGVVGLEELADAFDESRLPEVPAVVVTADRKSGSPVRAAHARIAAALAAPLVSWPAAEHHVHLSHPAKVLDAARGVIRQLS